MPPAFRFGPLVGRPFGPRTGGLASAALLLASLLPGLALAHDAWLEPVGKDLAVRYGHKDKADPYKPEKVREVQLLDGSGQPLASQRRVEGEQVFVSTSAAAALATLLFDNGYWSRVSMDTPSKNLPKNALPGAISGSHSLKAHKLVLQWAPVVAQAQGQRLEIVPQAQQQPAAGAGLPVQVLWDGRPLAGATLRRGGHDKAPGVQTDAQGRATVPVVAGRQMLLVSHSVDLLDDPRADRASWSANLVFTAR